jgi:hypothetical protein
LQQYLNVVILLLVLELAENRLQASDDTCSRDNTSIHQWATVLLALKAFLGGRFNAGFRIAAGTGLFTAAIGCRCS